MNPQDSVTYLHIHVDAAAYCDLNDNVLESELLTLKNECFNMSF